MKPYWLRLNGGIGIGRPVEVVLRVEPGVAQELERGAAHLVRTRLRRDVDLRDGAAVLRIEETRHDVELLERVDRRQQHVGVEVQVGVLDAVERVVVEVHALTRDVQRKAVALAAHALFALARRRPVRGGAGNQRRQLQVVAAVERQLDDRAVFDDGADRGVLGLNQRRMRDDFQRFRQVAHIHREGEPVRAAHLDDDAFPFNRPEPRQLGLQIVGAGRDGGDHIEADLVRLHDANDVRRLIGERDRRPRHGQAAAVDNGSADFPGRCLCVNRDGDREESKKQRDDRELTAHGASGVWTSLRREYSVNKTLRRPWVHKCSVVVQPSRW